MSSQEENAASHDDSTDSEFEESDDSEKPDPCVAGAIPFPSKLMSDEEEKEIAKQGKARATFMDSFNSSPMKLAESCYPEPLFLPEVVDLTDDAARLKAKAKIRDISEEDARAKATKEALIQREQKAKKIQFLQSVHHPALLQSARSEPVFLPAPLLYDSAQGPGQDHRQSRSGSPLQAQP